VACLEEEVESKWRAWITAALTYTGEREMAAREQKVARRVKRGVRATMIGLKINCKGRVMLGWCSRMKEYRIIGV
jgi:hypothetical protein